MNEEKLKEKLRAFVDEYEELCKKHGMITTGCSCCNTYIIIEDDLDNIAICADALYYDGIKVGKNYWSRGDERARLQTPRRDA